MKFDELTKKYEIDKEYNLILETISNDADRLLKEGLIQDLLELLAMIFNKYTTGLSVKDQRLRKRIIQLIEDAKSKFKEGNDAGVRELLIKIAGLSKQIEDERLRREAVARLHNFTIDPEDNKLDAPI